ncbi:DNA-binding protein VF530 [Emticicia sp. CRIBPO]|jgi:uncharacterized protein (DUF2132 family)|uniref:VF530 family protein n=1 Tax=Emticicia sp. CRIBPO TaxID=2683258 RepID=UPI00141315B8|nr:VF530 family protein [Emticicia sp. CRIBPO]NBA85089.1 DNA-binding protein VF530 [Emticicia sp. CRIBPO]
MTDKEPNKTQPNNPLHGVRLDTILEELVAEFGWDEMGYQVNLNCFKNNPTIKSSLNFLRKTPWARKKVEDYYIWMIERKK